MEKVITSKEAEELQNVIIALSNAQAFTFKEYARIMVICASALMRQEREDKNVKPKRYIESGNAGDRWRPQREIRRT